MQQQILLIDDSKHIHTLITSMLAEEPVTVHSAFDANYGLVLAASLRPDLILLDVEMPGINGYEACRQLRANPDTATFPVIFLTARGDTTEIVRGLNVGGNDYVVKPFKLSEMLSRIRSALRTGRLIRWLEENALIDALTGIGNRTMFEERLAAEVAVRARSGNPLSCIALEVDQFEYMNRAYGESFCEYVLSEIGSALFGVCRIEDIACRMAGENFAVLLPNTVADEATLLAERMRVAIEKLPFAQKDKAIRVTCSFSVAQALHPYDRSLLERADQVLAISRNSGCNRVLLDATPAPTKAVAA